MKLALLLCSFLPVFGFAAPAFAGDHRVELDGYGGIGLTGNLPVEASGTPGDLSFDAAPVYGGLASLRVQPAGFVYLSYSRQETTAYFRPQGEFDTTGQAPISFDYLQFGGNLEAQRGPWVPYIGFSLGTMRVASQETSASNWGFSVALEGGVKLEILPFLHLRLIGRMPVSFLTGGGSGLCVSGHGCAFAYSGDPLWQGQALLGLGLQL